MVRLRGWLALLFIVLSTADITTALINNTQIEERNELQDLETRRKHESTSSSGAAISHENEAESIDIVDTISSSENTKKKRNDYVPKSSNERTGWRKWHRKCTPCPEDMRKKWRDPTIKWICGAYQRARRTFKSLCMMHYRNCQDGTMFVKIHDHRCANSSAMKPHGDHFFYEYRVVMSDDRTNSRTQSETSSVEDASSY